MNKLFRYAAAAVLVASFGMLSDYTERSSGYAPVDEAVKKAILQWKFTPAIGTDQKAHESIIGMTITLPKQAVKAK